MQQQRKSALKWLNSDLFAALGQLSMGPLMQMVEMHVTQNAEQLGLTMIPITRHVFFQVKISIRYVYIIYVTIMWCYYWASLCTEWSIVEGEKECSGDEISKGRVNSVEDCAKACRDYASMFIFGTNDFSRVRQYCNANGCECYCETSAKEDRTCDTVTHNGFRLYRFTTSGKH